MANYTKAVQVSKSRQTARIPLVTDKHITELNSAATGSTNDSTIITNGIIERYQGESDRTYVRARPSLNMEELGPGGLGRGIYYWDGPQIYVIVLGNTIYLNDYSTPVTGTLSGQVAGVSFVEWNFGLNNYLFIIDGWGDGGYYLENTVTGTLKTMTGSGITAQGDTYDFTNFPNPVGQIPVSGAVDLDEYLFVAYSDNYIYNSAVGNFLDWSTENRIKVDTIEDDLLAIARSKDHLVAIGSRSTELFYDAANPSGSPLAPRKDIFYNIGMVENQRGKQFWVDGDDIYFVSTKPSGDFGLHVIKNMQMQNIPFPTFSNVLQTGREQEDVRPFIAGFSTGGHTYCVISLHKIGTGIQVNAIVYDVYAGAWYEWGTPDIINTNWDLVDYTFNDPDFPKAPKGQTITGLVVNITDNFTPTETREAFVAQPDEIIAPEVIIGNVEFDSINTKFMHQLQVVAAGRLETAAILNISWSDDDGDTWTTPIPLNVLSHEHISRLGSFIRRKFKVSWDGTTDTPLRVEALEVVYSQGSA